MPTYDIELGRITANTHSHAGKGGAEKLRIVKRSGSDGADDAHIDADASQSNKAVLTLEGSGDSIGKIIIDTDDARGREIKLRSVEVCVNGVTKYALVLMSEPSDTAPT